MAAQKVQKEAQAALEVVQEDLNAQRSENERLSGSLADVLRRRITRAAPGGGVGALGAAVGLGGAR